MEWVRGDTIGYGSFSTVSLAIPRKDCDGFPPLMAVKSSDIVDAGLLKNEEEVLDQLGVCPQIIQCFGHDQTVENGEKLYNLFLEYASVGSLANLIKKSGGGLPESDVRRYTKSILKGLSHIHAKGFAHCDIKLHNILMFEDGEIKIADFGLAKKTGQEEEKKVEFRGTPLYMAPESVNDNEYDSPADIWALGCAVVEMATAKPAWNFKAGSNITALIIRIGVGDELPIIPEELSDEGKDFLSKCFVRDPKARWTAEMLMGHPFLAADHDHEENDHQDDDTVPLSCHEEVSTSPRSPFDFPDWISVQSSVRGSVSCTSPLPINDSESSLSQWVSSPQERLRPLVTNQPPDWSVSESWMSVR